MVPGHIWFLDIYSLDFHLYTVHSSMACICSTTQNAFENNIMHFGTFHENKISIITIYIEFFFTLNVFYKVLAIASRQRVL